MYTLETKVRYSECGAKEHVRTASIFDYMQDACIFEAEELGVGIDYMRDHQCALVLNSWQADISRYPRLGDKIKISTWLYAVRGFYGYRNYMIEDAEGTVLVRANSIWIFLDLKKGRPVRVTPEIANAYPVHEQLSMEYADRRIPDFEPEESFGPVRIPDRFMDTNHHVNNTKYFLLAEELLPPDFCAARICAEYRRAAVCGDFVYPCMLHRPDRISVALNDQDKIPYAMIEFYT